MDMDEDQFEELGPEEARASELEEGVIYREFGCDPHLVAKLDRFGDTMLVTTDDGTELTLDIDEVIEVVKGWVCDHQSTEPKREGAEWVCPCGARWEAMN